VCAAIPPMSSRPTSHSRCATHEHMPRRIQGHEALSDVPTSDGNATSITSE
jgi:hypothetical protein